MDNQPQPPGIVPPAPTTTTEVPPQPAPPAGRSDLQHMYPPVGDASPARTESARSIQDQLQADATMSFYDAIAAVGGIASYLLSPLMLFMLDVENTWLIIGSMAAVAATSIVFAYMGYRASKRMSPLGVIGVAASTTTLLYVLNVCLTYMLLKSGASYFSPWSGL